MFFLKIFIPTNTVERMSADAIPSIDRNWVPKYFFKIRTATLYSFPSLNKK